MSEARVRFGVAISLREPTATSSVIARRGSAAAVSEKVKEAFGIILPLTPGVAAEGCRSVLWNGHQHWLLRNGQAHGDQWEVALSNLLGPLASVADVSAGRAHYAIEGPQSRELLATGVPIDLDAVVFGEGALALTQFDHFAITLWRSGPDVFEVLVASSYARSFEHALEAAQQAR